MCGIRCCILSRKGNNLVEEDVVAHEQIPEWLQRRGPDGQQTFCWPINGVIHHGNDDVDPQKQQQEEETGNGERRWLLLQASVLCLRPQHVAQPVRILDDHDNKSDDDNGDGDTNNTLAYFCWNGEIYPNDRICTEDERKDDTTKPLPTTRNPGRNDAETPPIAIPSPSFSSDTAWMAQQIQLLFQQDDDDATNGDHDNNINNNEPTAHQQSTTWGQRLAQDCLATLTHAEFSFCVVIPRYHSIYYGRDALGRRSLVVSTTTMMMNNDSNEQNSNSLHWQVASVGPYVPSATRNESQEPSTSTAMNTREVPPGIVFHYNYRLGETRQYPWKVAAAWSSPVAPPRLRGNNSLDEASQWYRQQLLTLLRAAVQRRLSWEFARRLTNEEEEEEAVHKTNNGQDDEESSSNINNNTQWHSKCAVLFSGGLDSVVLAYLALQLCPHVELVNVSFVLQHANNEDENQKVDKATRTTTTNQDKDDKAASGSDNTARKQGDGNDSDRKTSNKQKKTKNKKKTKAVTPQPPPMAADTKAALESLSDLQRLFPGRNLKFTHRQVTWEEIQAVQKERIPQLLYPKGHPDINIVNNTMMAQEEEKEDGNSYNMDLNIATALWFAADTVDNDTRIVMTGLGADEWLAGYGRHRQAFERGGPDELRQELQRDQERLWRRNLGRDDRILSDLGKEVRYPFLDAHVTQFLQHQVPLEYLCCFEEKNTASRGNSDINNNNNSMEHSLPGDKRLLRLLARDLGLEAASKAVKRAIQFGSRISHVVDKQRFGSRRKANKDNKKKNRDMQVQLQPEGTCG